MQPLASKPRKRALSGYPAMSFLGSSSILTASLQWALGVPVGERRGRSKRDAPPTDRTPSQRLRHLEGGFRRLCRFQQQSGVRRYRVLRPTDDPNYVIIELEFDSSSEAEAFLAALRRNVWSSQEAAPALRGEPQTRIVEAVEVKEY
jgi:hypothetical protein